jgi:hypothetical protein
MAKGNDMTQTFSNLEEFHAAHSSSEGHYGTINADGSVTDHETFSAYKDAHPEDFHSVSNGNIDGAIPLTVGTVEMILASESVRIEELPFNDVVIHPHK